MQSSSPVRKSTHKLPPLTEEAARLASKRPAGGSTPSTPDIAALLERFDEPLRSAALSSAAKPPSALPGQDLAEPPQGSGAPQSSEPTAALASAAPKRSGLRRNALISALALVALVPLAILFGRLWQDMMQAGPSAASSTASINVKPAGASSALEVALTSPEEIKADTGAEIPFPIAIDATAALPARSVIAVSAMPEGASFSAGRPNGTNGWSLRPDEIAGLKLRLPAGSGASDMRLALVAGDGTVLSQSETRVGTPSLPPAVATTDDPVSAEFVPLEQMATAGAVESAPAVESATADMTGSIADAPPAPVRRPSATAEESSPKVNTVKVVTIAPPRETKPHDGAYALGSPADEPQEWMETKTAVDMHAKAEQSSETVKVAQGGLKVRVKARDKNWVQVTDPKSATTGWIYNRFLKPAGPPAQ